MYGTRETKWTVYRDAQYAARKAGKSETEVKQIASATMAKWETERAAMRAAKKATKTAKAMTCQICGRAIFAELGTIAHHGYERPGHGWQTASCYGAKRLPYEVSREAIEELLPRQIAEVKRLVKVAADYRAERLSIHLEYKLHGDYNLRHAPYRSTTVTRETLPYALYFVPAAFGDSVMRYMKPNGTYFDYGTSRDVDLFSELCKTAAKSTDKRRAEVAEFVKYLEKRRDAWKLTHAWNKSTKAWETV